MNHITNITVLAVVTVCICSLTACRRDEQKDKTSPDAAGGVMPPPRRPDSHQEQSLPYVSRGAIIADDITKKDSADKEFQVNYSLKQIEDEREIVFAVPLNDIASREREEAWIELTTEKFSMLAGEKCVYASRLIDRYGNSTALEKLVFWRLIYLRMYEQGASATSRILDDYQQVRAGMPNKLNGLLYSALNEDPDKLPIHLATMKGMEVLRRAGKKASQ